MSLAALLLSSFALLPPYGAPPIHSRFRAIRARIHAEVEGAPPPVVEAEVEGAPLQWQSASFLMGEIESLRAELAALVPR